MLVYNKHLLINMYGMNIKTQKQKDWRQLSAEDKVTGFQRLP